MRQTMTIAGLERGRSFIEQMEGMLRGTLRWEYTPEGEAMHVTVSADYEVADREYNRGKLRSRSDHIAQVRPNGHEGGVPWPSISFKPTTQTKV